MRVDSTGTGRVLAEAAGSGWCGVESDERGGEGCVWGGGGTTTVTAKPSCSSARGEGPLAATELRIAALGSRTVGRRRRPPQRRRRAERAAGAGLLGSGGGDGGAEGESAEGDTASSEAMEESSSSSPASSPGSSGRKVGSLSPDE